MQDVEIKQDKDISIRVVVAASDRPVIQKIVESTGLFTEEEVLIAVELVDEALAKGSRVSGYYFLFAELNGQILGFTCFGPIPGCEKRHEIYWIAVEKKYHRLGIGSLLLRKTEEAIAARGGQRSYIETSSRPDYQPTQKFYVKSGYSAIAELFDYFRDGDGKIIFMKQLNTGVQASISGQIGVSGFAGLA
jgi:ribosomal protein S18 acetylase RimI-like enzyme